MTFPLGRSHLHGWILLCGSIAGVLLVSVWAVGSQQLGWRQLTGIAAVFGASWVAFRGWKNSPVGQLAWDGQVWRWEGPGYQAGVAQYDLWAAADFKNVMLLRIENQAHATLWLWAERKSSPERWLDLRRAVYSPHRRSTGVRHSL